MNDDEFEDYIQISPIAAGYYESGGVERVKLLLYAVNNEERPFYEVILLATIILDTDSHPMPISSLTVDNEFTFSPPSNYTPGVAAFVFTSLNPVEGIGCGAADRQISGVDYQKIMLFEISDS